MRWLLVVGHLARAGTIVPIDRPVPHITPCPSCHLLPPCACLILFPLQELEQALVREAELGLRLQEESAAVASAQREVGPGLAGGLGWGGVGWVGGEEGRGLGWRQH